MESGKSKSDTILSRIDSPKDLKNLSVSEMDSLAAEIREELIDVISETGGHLAPNLGVVELTIALHYVFNAPADKLIWDVGHQGYVHKLLTGRKELFKTLRKFEGCLGFLSRQESEYDVFGAGHAGTAISAALGMAAARDRKGTDEKIVAVVGDGSLNCGISLEGLNNVYENTKDMIIILNDNKMSISENVGAIPRCLNRIISGRSYNRFKAMARLMVEKIPLGKEIRRKISRVEEATKSLFVPGVFFEEIGIRYVGPIDGHDFHELIRTLEGIKEFQRPVILHVITEKGHGYPHAEKAPEKFHGLSAFDPLTGENKSEESSGTTFSSAFGKTMCELAENDKNVCAITAAMRSGTGLKEYSEKFTEQFYDVGIAEEHALVFAAGLAAGGLKPVVAVYSTFLQRALDCVFHDICLQNLPVLICTDRSGAVEDGPTHHGIHDLAFLRNIPNLAILQPKDENELRAMMIKAMEMECPAVVRYPRGGTGRQFDRSTSAEDIEWGKAEKIREGNDLAIWASGAENSTALKAAEILSEKYNINASVFNSRFIMPFDNEALISCAKEMPVMTIEDCQTQGGLGSTVDECLANIAHKGIYHFGWGLDIIPHGTVSDLKKAFGLTPEQIAEKYASEFSTPRS